MGKNKPSIKVLSKFKAIEEGTFYARDLVSEPGNILHPDEYAKRISSLKKLGLKINVYDEKKRFFHLFGSSNWFCINTSYYTRS